MLDDWARTHPARAAPRLGDAGARAAQDQAAACGGGWTTAGRRVDRQLLAAAVRRRRAAARAVLAGRGSRRLPAVHDSDAVRSARDTCSACGTRPTAACSSTARISSRCRRARGTSCSTRPAASRASRRCPGYLYNAGRWEATVFDHLAMFWAQGGELVDRDGRPIFGEEPNRRAMLRVLGFLRDTIQRGASPRSVLGITDYQQLTGAAVAGDAAMFLGGNWQQKDLQTGLSPAEFAKWDIAPIPQADANTRSTGTGGWVWVVFAQDPAAPEGRGRIHSRRRGARARGAHQRGDRPSAGAAERLSRLSDLQPGLVVPPLRRDARRRPCPADGVDLPGDIAAAAAGDRRGRVWRQVAGAGARRGVERRSTPSTRGRHRRGAPRPTTRRPDRLDPDGRSPRCFRSRSSGADAATAAARRAGCCRPPRW